MTTLFIVTEFIFMTIIVVENGLVLIAFVKNKKLRSVLTHYYLIQLALTNLATGAFLSVHIASLWRPAWFEPRVGCAVRYLVMVVPFAMSMQTLLAITFDRFIAVVLPFFYRRNVSRKGIIVLCTIINVGSILLFGVLPVSVSKSRDGRDDYANTSKLS
ncbi:unnamed protein product [Dimorphilus gyrociliatus]|uniref:G-protein coupled receptors family 1 profile domain-containing protein n=1 Tax=Dimorphilus gyrociliatus TaxID=2664684 RepID=A0A7I8VZH2_9ANNE|nr:unnamed protein product [Dimorphilus gyrociliatus]